MMIRMKSIALSFVITSLCLSASLSADDTEIFFAKTPTGDDASGKILFMFDTSGSMDGTDGLSLTRIDRLKKAMLDVLDSGVNVRIGVGAFNGKDRGGSILVPPVAMNEDRCENGACDRIRVRASVSASEDDGHESALGAVELGYNGLVMSQYEPTWNQETEYFKLKDDDDDAMEFPDGTFDLNSDTLMFFGDDENNAPAVGIRIEEVDVPQGAHITSADLAFVVPSPTMTAGVKHARIRVDGTEESPSFSDSPGKRVLDRPYLPNVVEWREIRGSYSTDDLVKTSDIAQLVQARVNQPDWEAEDAMSFIFEHSGDLAVSSSNRRAFKARDGISLFGERTRLKVVYSTNPIPSQTVGMRFTKLNIPRGATIENAHIGFDIESTSSSIAKLEISAQATGNAEPFIDTPFNLSGRTKTTSRITWTPEAWSDTKWQATSTDIGPVIQELVNRSDWCGGNAMAVLITGTGMRTAESYDKNPWSAPVLNVNYTPGTVDFTDTCLSQTARTRISNPVDDVFESMNSGAVTTNSTTIDTRDTHGANTMGLRFQGLNIPQGAKVVDAYVRLVAATDLNDSTSVKVYGEDSAYSTVFNANFDHDVSLRVPTQASVAWNNIEPSTTGAGIKSPNLASIIEEIIAKPGWLEGNPLTLVVEGDSTSTGMRSFKTLEDGAPATLAVIYQLDESDLAGESVPLRTGRDDLVAAMLDMVPLGSTQLIDAYYEAAAYLTGNPVVFGKQRGDGQILDRFYHVSAADTYTGGQYYRPPLCEETDLHSEACVGERIDLSPVYAPDASASCQVDQIVLLSDGEATRNNARGLVQSLTGKSTCAYRSVDDEDCGLELSAWLSTTDHNSTIGGTQPIITHTVGFNFSSSFLEEVATSAGGGFYTANSSSDLISVFSNIITTTADVNTSFVAPTTTVSQTNRLANSNDLYFGLFHPSNSERWDGNLKKYQFAKSSDDPNQAVIVGAGGKEAFDPATGTINDEAQSIWSTTVDGAEVSKGGAASQMGLSRDILTYTDGNAAPFVLEPLNESNANITVAMLNIDATQPDYRNELLKWSRGVDIKDFDTDGNTVEVRTQIGDPLHSSPSILNYPDRSLIFMGTNEGFLHAIDTLSGAEEFAFIPKPLLSNLDRFFKDAPSTKRVYGLDGPITSWINETNDNNIVESDKGESAYLVVGMRRGGRDYYALNVTDPDNPKLAWIIEGGNGDFQELGQTWSKPIRTRIMKSGVARDVLIFAAGYDEKNDNKVVRDKTDTMGRGLFIVDAHTGERLAYQAPIDQNDMYYSIPSDLRVIDINLDGFIDTVFVGDTGGQLWRFDIDNQSTGNLNSAITGGVVADLGGPDGANYRRFFSEPDVALTSDSTHGEFLTIAIGSGFRAHPLDVQVKDRFHVLRDPSVFSPPMNASDQISYSKLTSDELFDATTASARDSNSDKLQNGWFINLTDNGEKSMSKAITVNKQILFTTYLPESGNVGVCDVSLGHGRVYAVDALFGGAVANLDSKDGDSDTDELTTTDRHRNLKSPGIPPAVTALIPEASSGTPLLLAGPEQLPALDFGKLFKRTFWASH